MKFAVLRFPGSNCDQDCLRVARDILNQQARYVWHKDTELDEDEVILLPGGFTYGDYLRCGAVASHSPIMKAVKEAAGRGQIIIGICNGFQVLCESGLLPGALTRNRNLHFICEHVRIRVENHQTRFTSEYLQHQILNIPIAHGEGCYLADDETLEKLESNGQVLFRYVNKAGEPTPEANPNGSLHNIAGICNEAGNVLGLMPHPERASEILLGSEDGRGLFESVLLSQWKEKPQKSGALPA